MMCLRDIRQQTRSIQHGADGAAPSTFTVNRFWRGARRRARITAVTATLALAFPHLVSADAPLRVFTTTPDLGSITRSIGGDRVAVTVMAKGSEDAHFLEAKPSFIKELSQSDLFIQVGMDLELGYAPLLLQNARNGKVLPGNPGYLDASTAIAPLDVPSAPVDRSMGDVHPYGNPHYLLDPVNGLRVARLISERLAALRPSEKERFNVGYEELRRAIGAAMVGTTLAQKYDAEKLAILFERGTLEQFLTQQGDRAALGGWFAALLPYHGAKVVDDHPMWPYFARRFGLDVVGHLEPKPGIQPTTGHLTALIQQMKSEHVAAILAAPYYDPRHAAFVANATGAQVVYLAHMVGGRDGTDDYVRMLDYDVTQLAAALARAPGADGQRS